MWGLSIKMENFRCISIICDLFPLWSKWNSWCCNVKGSQWVWNIKFDRIFVWEFVLYVELIAMYHVFCRVLELNLQNATFPELSASMVSIATFHKMEHLRCPMVPLTNDFNRIRHQVKANNMICQFFDTHTHAHI